MALTAADRPLGAAEGVAETSDPGAIRVCVRELPQIFNPIDPSPLAERDLNDEAERFIVSWARELRALLRRGRTSLVIGLVFLTACVLAGDLATSRLHDGHVAGVLREGLTVAGWVAMWRPMEIFLYNWWPLAGDRRLYARLSRMPVLVRESSGDPRPPAPATLPFGRIGGTLAS